MCAEQLENYSFHEYGKQLRRIAQQMHPVETTSLTEAEKLLKAWADPLPPNGKLYWTHVEKAREYFKKRPAVEPSAGNHAAGCGAHDGKRCDCHMRGYRDAIGELVLPHDKADGG